MISKNWKILLKLLLKPSNFICISFFSINLSIGFNAWAYQLERPKPSADMPKELKNVQIDEKLGSILDLEPVFTNDLGKTSSLKKYFTGEKPVLLSIVYYGCPNLCTLHLNGLGQGLQSLPNTFKQEFEWVVISMDPKETFLLAAQKKQNYAKKYSFPLERMHFLTGSKENIARVSESLGFHFYWDASQKIYAHLPVAYVLTPTASISRYLYGVEFSTQTLKLSLVEAGENHIGTIVDKILLFCFQFNPKQRKYAWYAYNIMRAGGVVTMLLLFGFLIPVWIKENKKLKTKVDKIC